MTLVDHEKLLTAALARTPEKYLSCRDTRHLWQVEKDLHLDGQISGRQRVERTLICSRCGTVKIEHYALHTSISGIQRLASVGYHYVYPSEYAIPEMSRAESPREILRAARFSRSVPES